MHIESFIATKGHFQVLRGVLEPILGPLKMTG